MSKTKKLFVVSDIHGHGALLKEQLEVAGFDDDNEDHLFICCGDLFDRGSENKMVYDFIRRLKRKVLVRGNHDERLAEVLERKRVDVYDIYNGMVPTLEEFFGAGVIGDYGDLELSAHGETVGNLSRLIGEMVNYYETKSYVFVHGWIPTEPLVTPPQLLENWRNASSKAWRSARFLEWMSLYKTPAMLEGKTIICGHRPTRYAAQVDMTRAPADSSIYYGDGMIAIDAGSIRSKRMNLLVIEDELLDE